MRHHVELVSTSRADDLAYLALADVADISRDEHVRIVGGHMTAILLGAFPVAGVDPRRTGDADAAITTELAASGALHERLIARGYTPTAGNSYVRAIPALDADADDDILSVDLLVPTYDGRFRSASLGGRAFDAVPGLALALDGPAIEFEVGATLLDASVVTCEVDIPTVEAAVILKAHAWASRHEARDIEDLYRLLEIVEQHDSESIGGWRLNSTELIGTRRDAAAHLHELGRRLRTIRDLDVPRGRLSSLIAGRVARPTH